MIGWWGASRLFRAGVNRRQKKKGQKTYKPSRRAQIIVAACILAAVLIFHAVAGSYHAPPRPPAGCSEPIPSACVTAHHVVPIPSPG